MITMDQRYLMTGFMALILLLTFKDLMPKQFANANTEEVDREEMGREEMGREEMGREEGNADHKYTRRSNQDPYMESEENLDEDGFGMPVRPIEKTIPKTNLRHIITGPTIKITYW